MDKKYKDILLKVARNSIKYYLQNHKRISINKNDFPDDFLWEEKGTFVTLTIDSNLRGCIGSILPEESLILSVASNAVNAAFYDPRFYHLTKDEFEKIEIEISILSLPEEILFNSTEDLFSKIEEGIDGIIIEKSFNKATFLPQVWEDLKAKEEFFTHLCIKAGLPYNCFKDKSLKVKKYRVEAFKEEKR